MANTLAGKSARGAVLRMRKLLIVELEFFGDLFQYTLVDLKDRRERCKAAEQGNGAFHQVPKCMIIDEISKP